MRVELNEIGRLVSLSWPGLAELVGLVGVTLLVWSRSQAHAARRWREQRVEEELEAYDRLETRLPQDGDMPELGERVCKVVSQKSLFYRVAMLLRDDQRRLKVVGSAGMDNLTALALNTWGERVEAERGNGEGASLGAGDLGMRVGNGSFAIVLELGPHELDGGRAIVVPLRTTTGRMVGALAVCADGMMRVPRRAVDEALAPLETLAVKLGRALENSILAERLLRAEKLAGLGMLAGGMAHALNNPLTSVLGFAELIADTSDEPRVKTDAAMIVREALRMRETVDLLLEFWRPPIRKDEPVDFTELVAELAEECREKLVNRGVRLVVETLEEHPVVRGNRDRLRQVLEHLLNNAAQAVAFAAEAKDGVEHTIRIACSHDGVSLHVIVSDTGPGFREPERVFDSFQTSEQMGLGLSICYGIVREHGGEITAVNLHPCGAAVMMELPVWEIAMEKDENAVAEVAHVVSD